MYKIVALGNPGDEYAKTRHNAGRIVMEEVIKTWSLPSLVNSSKYDGAFTEGVVAGEEIMVLFPNTYMNHSGRAARKVVAPKETERLVVVYDDIDIGFGEFKLSFGRGSGGHNGVDSVITELDTQDFLRVRVGIAPRSFFGNLVRPKGEKLVDYVLGKLTAREEKKLIEISASIKEALETLFKEGKEKAMNRFN